MSRIFGVVGWRGDSARRATDAMARALAFSDAWTAVAEGDVGARLGWTGPRAPRLATRGPLSVAVDGHVFESSNDERRQPAEVVLDLYEKHGFAGALQRVGGEFAIALQDSRSDVVYLGRDRLGVKPLYYSTSRNGLAFASQPRGLLVLNGVSHDVNESYVARFAGLHYRAIDNSPEESPYRDIAQLPAGSALEFRNGSSRVSRYWDLQEQPEHRADEAELAEEYRALLRDAVGRRLDTVERAGFLLSGGMDSSSVLASGVDHTGTALEAFSTVYRDPTYDERDEIASMLETKVSNWHPVEIGDPDVFRLVGRMVDVHDEPVATATWLSHYLLAERAATDGVTALFGGLGGDELNAGEYEYFVFHFADLLQAGEDDTLEYEIARWAALHDHPIYKKSPEVAVAALKRRTAAGRNLPDEPVLYRYASTISPDFADVRSVAPAMSHPFSSHLKNRAYQDLFRETTPCCLRAEDRQTTAFGIDHFDPFLDHRVVDFMFRVPGTFKIREGVTKYLLRKAMKGVLPEATRTRVAKTGWNAPAHLWFTGSTGDQLEEMIRSPEFRDRGVYDVAEVLRILADHRRIVESGEQRENHMMFFWQLVNLETWFQRLDEQTRVR